MVSMSVSVAVSGFTPYHRPPALQSWDAAHETPSRRLWNVEIGLGLGMIDQLAPFQNSLSVRYPPAPAERFAYPTALQNVSPVHDTARRLSFSPNPVLGLGISDHADPFQSSAKVPSPLKPTAMHHVERGHDTP
jgi:hypothetical protein